jgi:hypothetical protein
VESGGVGCSQEGEDSEGLAEGLESMALRSARVRRDAPTAEMQVMTHGEVVRKSSVQELC